MQDATKVFKNDSYKFVQDITFILRNNLDLSAELLHHIETAQNKHIYEQRFFSSFTQFFMDNPYFISGSKRVMHERLLRVMKIYFEMKANEPNFDITNLQNHVVEKVSNHL